MKTDLMSIALDNRPERSVAPRIQRLGRTVRAHIRELRFVTLAVPAPARMGYVGWTGQGNMGDEAMLQACQLTTRPWNLTRIPHGRVLSVLAGAVPHPLIDGVMLGGGTLIGQSAFRQPLATLFDAYPHLLAFTMGTGVEEPGFEDPPVGPTSRELRRWEEVLARCGTVTVRGPASKETLATFGIQSRVIGDPALLLADAAPHSGTVERLLGLNIGLPRKTWHRDPDSFLDLVTTCSRILIRQGWRVRLFCLARKDIAFVAEAARRIGAGVEISASHGRLHSLLRDLRDCHVVIGMRLHSVVLASAVYVPWVSLEYAPKCRDFSRSMDLEDWGLRTDRVDSADLIALIEDHADRLDQRRALLFDRVSSLRRRLEQHVQTIREAFPSPRRSG